MNFTNVDTADLLLKVFYLFYITSSISNKQISASIRWGGGRGGERKEGKKGGRKEEQEGGFVFFFMYISAKEKELLSSHCSYAAISSFEVMIGFRKYLA